MSVTPTLLEIPIHRGASLVEDFERLFYPYEVEWVCGRWVKACSGEPAPEADAVPEDYTGCTAIAVLVPELGSTQTIAVLSTANLRLILDGRHIRFRMSAADTAALVYGDVPPAWTSCVAYVYVTRPNGTVEPQFFVTFTLSQGTPTEPPP